MKQDAWYEAKISAAAEIALSEMKRDPATWLYAWFCRGDVVVAPEQPPGMSIVTPEPVPSNRPLEVVRAWLWERCRRVECLPVEPAGDSARSEVSLRETRTEGFSMVEISWRDVNGADVDGTG